MTWLHRCGTIRQGIAPLQATPAAADRAPQKRRLSCTQCNARLLEAQSQRPYLRKMLCDMAERSQAVPALQSDPEVSVQVDQGYTQQDSVSGRRSPEAASDVPAHEAAMHSRLRCPIAALTEGSRAEGVLHSC